MVFCLSSILTLRLLLTRTLTLSRAPAPNPADEQVFALAGLSTRTAQLSPLGPLLRTGQFPARRRSCSVKRMQTPAVKIRVSAASDQWSRSAAGPTSAKVQRLSNREQVTGPTLATNRVKCLSASRNASMVGLLLSLNSAAARSVAGRLLPTGSDRLPPLVGVIASPRTRSPAQRCCGRCLWRRRDRLDAAAGFAAGP